jgi:hypothetical protein
VLAVLSLLQQTNDEIVARALALIDPKPERAEEARRQITRAIAIISEPEPKDPLPDNRQIRKVASALQAASAVLKHPWVWEFADDWRQLCERLETIATNPEAVCLTKRGPRLSEKKWMAARSAYSILRSHGAKPTLYRDGAWFQLAATLYEGATGIADANLERACEWWAHRIRR